MNTASRPTVVQNAGVARRSRRTSNQWAVALGKGVVATRLELLWNRIAKTRVVDILCGYPLVALTSHWIARSSNESVQAQPFVPGEGVCVLVSGSRNTLWVRTAAPLTGEPCSRTCNSLSGTVNSVKP